MPSRRLKLSEPAISDLQRLSAYISQNSGLPLTARAYVSRIQDRCAELCDFPFVGRSQDHIKPGLRVLPFESVAIAFEVTETQVRVRRIFGQRQDYDKWLQRLHR